MPESYPKLVENTVGKGEIARFPGASKGVIVWEWVKWSLSVSQFSINQKIVLFGSLLPFDLCWECPVGAYGYGALL